MTPFCLEHEFRAASIEAVLAAYFDDDHQVEQDRVLAIVEREVLERTDGRRVCRVVPHRTWPTWLQPFVTRTVTYVESVTRDGDELAIEIRPSLPRVVIAATYRLTQVGPQAIRRRYAGTVSVNIALIGSRLERGIVDELARSVPLAAACTQAWLDRIPRYMTARA